MLLILLHENDLDEFGSGISDSYDASDFDRGRDVVEEREPQDARTDEVGSTAQHHQSTHPLGRHVVGRSAGDEQDEVNDTADGQDDCSGFLRNPLVQAEGSEEDDGSEQ